MYKKQLNKQDSNQQAKNKKIILAKIENVWTEDGAYKCGCISDPKAHVPSHGGEELSVKHKDEAISTSDTYPSSQGKDLQHDVHVCGKKKQTQTQTQMVASRKTCRVSQRQTVFLFHNTAQRAPTFRNQPDDDQQNSAECHCAGDESGSREPLVEMPVGNICNNVNQGRYEAVEVDISIQVAGIECETVEDYGYGHPAEIQTHNGMKTAEMAPITKLN